MDVRAQLGRVVVDQLDGFVPVVRHSHPARVVDETRIQVRELPLVFDDEHDGPVVSLVLGRHAFVDRIDPVP